MKEVKKVIPVLFLPMISFAKNLNHEIKSTILEVNENISDASINDYAGPLVMIGLSLGFYFIRNTVLKRV